MTEYFYEDFPDCDVIVEPGVSLGPHGSQRIIGAFANSDKGVAFPTAYCQSSDDELDGQLDDDEVIESGSEEPAA
jgi:hypothetical protein